MTVRVARLTPSGSGAIATVAVVGPAAWDTIAELFRLANGDELDSAPLPGSLHFGKFGSTIGDEVVLAHRPDMREPWYEVHCHGGREVVAWIIEQLSERGAKVVDWTELERLQTQSWIRAEAASELSRALTLKAAGILLDQQHGALERALQGIRDYVLGGHVEQAQTALYHLTTTSRIGLRLTQPFRIGIFGAPNVGKSCLINRIAGYERAVVSSIAGTTRELTTTVTAIGGWPVELYDTPGIRQSTDVLEAEGVRRSQRALDALTFDLVLWIWDRSVHTTDPGEFYGPYDLIVLNKCDLPAKLDPIPSDMRQINVSALTGDGLPALLDEIATKLVGGTTTDQGVLFTTELVHVLNYVRDLLREGQLHRSQQVLDALLQSEKPQFSILAN